MGIRSLVLAACAAACAPFAAAADSGDYKVVHVFRGVELGDGSQPHGGLVAGPGGAFYGTTQYGGTGCENQGFSGCGTVFRLNRDGSVDVIYAFEGGKDGRNPIVGLVADKAGNLYGVTSAGGSKGCVVGCGTIFKIAPDGTKTTLHIFDGGTDGYYPDGGLIIDDDGNLYGNTYEGGTANFGVVYKIAPDGTETILHTFEAQGDYNYPYGTLARDAKGNLYGTTDFVGGEIFKLTPKGKFTRIHQFGVKQGDGLQPSGEFLIDPDGTLYGTTNFGGAGGFGTVFKIAPDGTETVLYSFKGGTDGVAPTGPIVRDADGNIYGTAVSGGGCQSQCGIVYKLGTDGIETVLHTFYRKEDDTKRNQGRGPLGGVVLDANGDIFGTTSNGGKRRSGVLFRIRQ